LHHLGCYHQITNSTVSHSTKGLKQVQVTVLTGANDFKWSKKGLSTDSSKHMLGKQKKFTKRTE